MSQIFLYIKAERGFSGRYPEIKIFTSQNLMNKYYKKELKMDFENWVEDHKYGLCEKHEGYNFQDLDYTLYKPSYMKKYIRQVMKDYNLTTDNIDKETGDVSILPYQKRKKTLTDADNKFIEANIFNYDIHDITGPICICGKTIKHESYKLLPNIYEISEIDDRMIYRFMNESIIILLSRFVESSIEKAIEQKQEFYIAFVSYTDTEPLEQYLIENCIICITIDYDFAEKEIKKLLEGKKIKRTFDEYQNMYCWKTKKANFYIKIYN